MTALPVFALVWGVALTQLYREAACRPQVRTVRRGVLRADLVLDDFRVVGVQSNRRGADAGLADLRRFAGVN